MSGDRVLIPYGAVLNGHVEKAQPSEAADKRATLELKFDQLAGRSNTLKLPSKVIAVDNAREWVDDDGVIQGILASETLSARMDQGLSKLGERAQGLADILQIAKSIVVKTADSEIIYGPGVEMTLALTSKVIVEPGAISGVSITLQPMTAESRLRQLVNSQPFQTVAAKPPKESDLTNLMFIGSQQQLEAAFLEAGWTPAKSLNRLSALETFQAIAEMRGYKEAPMSVLLLGRTTPLRSAIIYASGTGRRHGRGKMFGWPPLRTTSESSSRRRTEHSSTRWIRTSMTSAPRWYPICYSPAQSDLWRWWTGPTCPPKA
jgi:hypothetical protein